MSYRRPHFGPYAGQLCRVVDGELVPVPESTRQLEPPVVLPPDDGRVAGPIQCEGEIAGPDTRGNREAMVRSIVEQHGEAYRGWARSKAENAVRNWDRGVRTGRIQRPPR